MFLSFEDSLGIGVIESEDFKIDVCLFLYGTIKDRKSKTEE
jgi:hypothetical protein